MFAGYTWRIGLQSSASCACTLYVRSRVSGWLREEFGRGVVVTVVVIAAVSCPLCHLSSLLFSADC